MREFSKTGIFLVVFLKSNEAEQCCFEVWTSWQQSSLTCGQVCEQRTRNLLESSNFFAAATAIFSNACNDDHSTCPDFESNIRSCAHIECRKFYFKSFSRILIFCSNFFKPLMPLIQNIN